MPARVEELRKTRRSLELADPKTDAQVLEVVEEELDVSSPAGRAGPQADLLQGQRAGGRAPSPPAGRDHSRAAPAGEPRSRQLLTRTCFRSARTS